jgi:hypothetical protein
MDPTQRLDLDIVRAMSPRDKLDVMNGLLRQAVALEAAWIKLNHPALDDAEVQAQARKPSQVQAPDLIELFAEPLERLGVRYMITGGGSLP